jgi:hypothetical protein
MRWGLDREIWRITKPRRELTRTERRHRLFKRVILAATILLVVGLVASFRSGRDAVASATEATRVFALRQIGLEPQRPEIEALHKQARARTVERTFESLSRFYRETEPQIRHMFDVAKMDPEHGLIGNGRVGDGFIISSKVFGPDSHGRSYRLLPNRKSIWLRQVTLHKGPFGLFLVPDNPEMRAAAQAAGAIVDEPSAMTTNSWGLRGPEPDPDAPIRGIVLGDSFMMGMFNGDQDTPPYRLQLALGELWGKPVSLVNTGHIGYAPEQYYHSLKEYGERFRPHFVVLSVCPNDFGPGGDVMAGRGDDWDEAKYWLEEIVQWCRSHAINCLLVPVPCDVQIVGNRNDARYPGRISEMFTGSPIWYCDPLDQFIDEHLRLVRDGERIGKRPPHSPLYNLHIADNHFSPVGAELWARIVARRLDLVVRFPKPPKKPTSTQAAKTPAPKSDQASASRDGQPGPAAAAN